MSQVPAVMALTQRCWNPRLFPDAGLKIYKELVRRARCFTLELGDLEEACELVEGLVGKGVFRQSVTRPVSSKG